MTLSMKYRAGLLSRKAMVGILRLSEEYRAGLYPWNISSDSTEDAPPRPHFPSRLSEDVWALSKVCRAWCKSRFTPGTEGRSVVSHG